MISSSIGLVVIELIVLINLPATKSFMLHQNAKVIFTRKRMSGQYKWPKKVLVNQICERPKSSKQTTLVLKYALFSPISYTSSLPFPRYTDLKYFHPSRHHAIPQHSVAPIRRHPSAPHRSSCTRPSSTLSSRKRRHLSSQTHQYPAHPRPTRPLLDGLLPRETELWELQWGQFNAQHATICNNMLIPMYSILFRTE
jgi:hypothetical protein